MTAKILLSVFREYNNSMICFCRYLNYTGTVIGEVIEHLLFLRGEVEKYAKIGTGMNA